MRVADYIIHYLEAKGVDTVFMITGGQAMFLNDAVAQSRKIKPVFHHHEQAAGMAAEAYGRISGKLGVAMVTAGPAAVNVLNGVVGAWVDSSPMLVLSGQSSSTNVAYMQKTNIRIYGLQGINIKPMAESVTKYFVTVDDPMKIQYYLDKAYFEATTGRKGPVWLEVPLDVSRMEVPEKFLTQFEVPFIPSDEDTIDDGVGEVFRLLRVSKCPLFIAGQGIRSADAKEEFLSFIKKSKIPVVTTRLGIDLIDSRNPLYVGRPGLYGERAANFAIQHADLIISIGARLDPGFIGYDAKDWGRNAKKIVVDLDQKELDKPSLNDAMHFKADAKAFLQTMLTKTTRYASLPSFTKWVHVIGKWKKRYPLVLPEYSKEHPVNSYYFSDRLSRAAGKRDVVVVDTSSPFHVVCQAWRVKEGQRFLTTGGISTMGYWPAAIGACVANKRARTIVVTGDGCLQMNIQEFATIKQNNLPIKVFIINNGGYLLIRHTQKTHMEGRLLGESTKTGLWCPDSLKIARAYEIKGIRITSVAELDRKIKEALDYNGPVICDVLSPHWQPIIPRVASEKMPDGSMVSKPFEDLYPFLDRDEFQKVNSVDW